jgi:hypothetical protein
MRREIARIEALTLEPLGEPAIEIACPKVIIPDPGQAVLAIEPGSDRPYRIKLCPTRMTPEGFITDQPPEPGWLPGTVLDLLGPVGRGFSPPLNTQRWLLLGVGMPPKRLWPLIDMGLERGIALSVWMDRAPLPLPPQVEFMPDLGEALMWADYLVVETHTEGLMSLRTLLGLTDEDQLAIPAEALITTALPCGFGACQGCAVESRRGWLLACKDGPVFDLEALRW